MSAAQAAQPAHESILCDTSFVSVMQSSAHPRFSASIASWPQAVKDRLSVAILAIGVVTLAELRDGHIYGRWGAERRNRAEKLIASYLLIPLDMPTVDCCARLRAACRSTGVTVPDNDIWIAATAITRGWPLVSCDRHFDAIPDLDHIKLDLVSEAAS
jgi:predicted nucleic acid-binding protein